MLTMGLVIACFPLSLALAGGGGASTAQQYFVWQLLRRPNHDLLFYPTVVPQAVGLLLLLVALVSLWVFRSSADWRLRLLLAWVFVPVTFFELWPTKGFQYLLPAAPVVAILAARLLVEWRPRRVPEAPRWVPKVVRQPRSLAVLIVAVSLAVQSAFTILGPPAGRVLAGEGACPEGARRASGSTRTCRHRRSSPTIGPSMGNILQFYGHRTARALSVSPDPLKRNPSYAPIRNADLSVRTGEFRYLVWDAFSAARTSHFSDKLMELVRRYDGRLVHVQSLSGAASGTTVGTPIIQIYEVQPAEPASLPAPRPRRRRTAYPSGASSSTRRTLLPSSSPQRRSSGRPSAASGSVDDDRAVDQAGGLRVPAHGLALWSDVGAGGHANISDDGYGLDHHGRCAPDRDGAPDPARPALSRVRPCRSSSTGDRRCESSPMSRARRRPCWRETWRLATTRSRRSSEGPRTSLRARAAAVTLHVIPATFTVRTVPAIAGLPLLRVDRGGRHCRPRRTARSGSRSGGPPVRAGSHPASGGTKCQLTFDRWGDGSRHMTRSIRLPGRSDLVIGLERKHLVEFGFVDATGAPVDPQRVESLLIANDRGEVMQPGATEPTCLIENRIMRVGGQLSSGADRIPAPGGRRPRLERRRRSRSAALLSGRRLRHVGGRCSTR